MQRMKLKKHLKILQNLTDNYDYISSGHLLSKKRKIKIIGTELENGYLKIKISEIQILYHQAIFLKEKGYIPKIIDHYNRNKKDNRIENLRDATNSQNRANAIKDRNSNNNFKGVNITPYGKYRAVIYKDKKKYNIGNFKTEKEAAIAYDKKARELFGDFAFTNF